MITTSYFSSAAPKARKVCIAKKAPWPFPAGLHVAELAPSNPWIKKDWQERYWQDLCARFPEGRGLRELLDRIVAQVPDPVLCCYEKYPSQCHREILARYIDRHLGMVVPEWAAGK